MNTDRDASEMRLACGADADDLLAQVAEGQGSQHSAHQQGCPHCQASLAEYERLWSPVRALATERVRAPESVLTEVLRQVRHVASNPTSGLLVSDRGSTRIAAQVVITTAREAAAQVPGVRAALSHAPTAGAHESRVATTAGVAGASTAIDITLAAEQGYDLPALGERIREVVAGELRQLTGLDPVSVTVVIDDVFPPPDENASNSTRE